MTLIGWLKAAGILGAYYLFQYGEWNTFPLGNLVGFYPNQVRQGRMDANTWVGQGASLYTTSGSIKAMTDVINEFNDVLDDIFLEANSSLGIVDEFFEIDENGIRSLPDLVITLPNGLSLTIIDSSALQEFRIDNSLDTWHGFVTPIGFGVALGYVAFRLKSDPSFEFGLPGSNLLNYYDPSDGLVKIGTDFTPNKYIYITDLEYITSCTMIFSFICETLKALGLVKTLKAWYISYVTKRSLKRIRDQIKDLGYSVEEVQQNVLLLSTHMSEVETNVSGSIEDVDVSKIADAFVKLKKLGYRPYG